MGAKCALMYIAVIGRNAMTTSKSQSETGVAVGGTLRRSSQAEMDGALAVLAAHKDAWARMDISGRIALLDQIKQDLPRIEKRWILAGLAAKEANPESNGGRRGMV